MSLTPTGIQKENLFFRMAENVFQFDIKMSVSCPGTAQNGGVPLKNSDALDSANQSKQKEHQQRFANKPKHLELLQSTSNLKLNHSQNSSLDSTPNQSLNSSRNQSPNPNYLSPGEESCVDWILPQSPTTKQRVYHIPQEGAIFQINNVRRYMRKAHRFVCTHYLYTKPKECCIRVKIQFQKDASRVGADGGYLKVCLLMAPGVYDEMTQFPVTLEGACALLNQTTKEYSELFRFHH